MTFEEKQLVKEKIKRESVIKRILGSSPAIKKTREQIKIIASCDASVLITGESGSGKELAAHAIHYLSDRSSFPFIPVNCGAIPENLFENELFGHTKGAFTNAYENQGGLVKEAQNGTLFLDEIGVINPYIQVKLLRLLQEKEFKPLGDPRVKKADIRIIAASNRELPRLVEDGSFREDLFFRLNIVTLHIPSLRERKSDIPELIEFFLNKYCLEYRKPKKNISERVLKVMLDYSWPGNIRELENKIQHLIVMAEGNEITYTDLPDFSQHTLSSVQRITEIESFKKAKQKNIDEFERSYLTLLMQEYKGDVVNAARKAGKSRTALWNLLSKHRLHPRTFQDD